MDDKVQAKLKRLQDLLEQKAVIEREIASIISPEPKHVRPSDFQLGTEVLKVVKEAGVSGIAKGKILELLQRKFRDYGITRKDVASSLAYLKNGKHQVDLVGRGVYKFVESPIT